MVTFEVQIGHLAGTAFRVSYESAQIPFMGSRESRACRLHDNGCPHHLAQRTRQRPLAGDTVVDDARRKRSFVPISGLASDATDR